MNAIEPAVAANVEKISTLNGVTSATTQAIGDFKAMANAQLAALDDAVFAPRYGSGCNNGGSPRFTKRDTYCLTDSSLQAIETCG